MQQPGSITTSQSLAAGALSWTPDVSGDVLAAWRPLYLTLHASASMVGAQTFTVTIDDVDGANYDTLIYSESIAGGTTDKLYTFPDGIREHGLEKDSNVTVTLTNTGTPASTVYVKLVYGV